MKHGHSEDRVIDPAWTPPRAQYGRGLIRELTDTDEDYAVITMEIPWDLVKDQVARPPKHVAFVKDMRLESVQALEAQVPPVDLVIGLGGGSSHDSAKYVAIKKDARLAQVPTIISGDACVTPPVGVRIEGKVVYIGTAVCDRVVVDYDVLGQAPPRLVRYGAGDVLSSHTALFDWKLAAERGKAEFNQEFYDRARRNLETLYENRFEIRDLTEQGIRTIIELYRDYALIAARLGNDRCQEGSEHFFAYNAERIAGRTFLHGGLLATGIFVITYLQENEHEHIRGFMDDMGFDYSLGSIGLSRDEFFETMETLGDFARSGGYYYSVVHDRPVSRQQVEALYEHLA